MSHPEPAAREVSCPTCRQPALFAPSNAWRPFCSERCRLIDQGAWASDRYRVASTLEPDSLDLPEGLDPPAASSAN